MTPVNYFLVSMSLLAGVQCIRITKMTVPKFVKNGTEESVVLDCEYEYDKDKDARLVVKWFHNDDPKPVYQWISEYNTVQSSDKFGDRVNINYEVKSGNKYTNRRALNILRPTTELSGTYSCQVTSFAGLDSKQDIMMVYAHPTDVYLNYSVSEDTVKVMCIIEGVYPLPEITMFQIPPGEVEPKPVEDVYQEHEMEDDAYNVVLSTNLSEDDLETDTLRYFGCIVSIPGTTYNETKKLPYFPAAKAEKVGADFDEDGTISLKPTLLLLFVVLLTTHIFPTC